MEEYCAADVVMQSTYWSRGAVPPACGTAPASSGDPSPLTRISLANAQSLEESLHCLADFLELGRELCVSARNGGKMRLGKKSDSPAHAPSSSSLSSSSSSPSMLSSSLSSTLLRGGEEGQEEGNDWIGLGSVHVEGRIGVGVRERTSNRCSLDSAKQQGHEKKNIKKEKEKQWSSSTSAGMTTNGSREGEGGTTLSEALLGLAPTSVAEPWNLQRTCQSHSMADSSMSVPSSLTLLLTAAMIHLTRPEGLVGLSEGDEPREQEPKQEEAPAGVNSKQAVGEQRSRRQGGEFSSEKREDGPRIMREADAGEYDERGGCGGGLRYVPVRLNVWLIFHRESMRLQMESSSQESFQIKKIEIHCYDSTDAASIC
eukprot:scaffold2611_cov253-Ochromonas_danica.AAC.1